MSNRSTIELLYFFSLMWYIFAIFFLDKITAFSGVGFYCVYLFFFVQIGLLFQKYYYTLLNETLQIVMIYNLMGPVVLFVLYKYTKTPSSELVEKQIDQHWVTILFWVGIAAAAIFFISVGRISLFAEDAENFRVEAISGRGFLILIASASFNVSVLLTSNNKKRIARLFFASLMLMGTGFRGQVLSLLLVAYITYWIGKGKRYILSAGIFIVLLGALYSILGVTRKGIYWTYKTLYMPAIWRIYVNSNNFNDIVKYFSSHKLYFYGRSIFMDLAIVLPGAQKSFMMQLKETMGYMYAGGTLTPSVFGEGFANFGTIGAMVWSILILVVIVTIDRKLKKNVDGRVYFALAFSLSGPSTSSVCTSFLQSLIPITLVYFTLLYVSNKFPIKSVRNGVL